MARIRTHPGEILREEFMKPLGLSANALALALRVNLQSAHDLSCAIADHGPAIERDVRPRKELVA
jgi:plasmid maintenance system antidote protein VapI